MLLVVTKYLLAVIVAVVPSCTCDAFFERVKRTDIDLSTCIDNFDIHKDKIIRTQDSQKMGAKYLNAIDLGSREECLRLCCETDDCDVFVYEDKNAGSCYLFHCGPPEDFKCKFTHHVNYSSAVLAVNRHIPDLESQIKLTKHEQDLTKLRKPEVPAEITQRIPEERIPAPIIPSTTAKTKEVLPEMKSNFQVEKKCSRFQFECRSTRECIAIYNACDGIPQCTDGSDEAPELGCPTPSTSPPPLQRVEQNRPQPDTKNIIPPSNQVVSQSNPNKPELRVDNRLPSPNADFVRPNPPQRVPTYMEPVEYNPQMGWNPHQTNQVPYQLPREYPGASSHIFNHKENGLQVPEAEISSYPDNANYPKITNYYGDNYRQPMETPNWVNAHQDDLRYPVRYNPQDPPYAPERPLGASDKYITDTKNSNWPVEKDNADRLQNKMTHELKATKNNQEVDEKDVKIKIVEKTVHAKTDDYPDVVAYKMDGKDGVAQTPGGAVLSLTFGVIITCIMAIMIGCRLRIVKRRIRKGGKGYAHDADYLVNGMYL